MHTKDDILQLITKNSPHLSWMNEGLMFLTLYGSRAYGTNTDTSDYDYKGFASVPKQYLFGIQHKFDQAELKAPNPDTSIYSLQKFFQLAAANNPSILEVLFTEPSDHIYVSKLGQKVLDNKDKFLSKRVRYSFAGYAVSQLKRIKTHKKYLDNPLTHCPTRKEMGLPEHTLIAQDQLMAAEASIKKELDRLNFDFLDDVNEPTKIAIKNSMSEMLSSLKLNADQQWLASARKIGLDDNFIELMQRERAYKNKKLDWDHYQTWKTNRNPERAKIEAKYGFDLKNAMQLKRLLLMSKEMMLTGKVIVKRPDAKELLEVRNGSMTYEEIIEFANKTDKELDEIYKASTILPNSPNMKFLDNLCIELIEEGLKLHK